MTKIKTAQAWGYADPQPIDALRPMAWASRDKYGDDIPVVIVHGMTEAEVHEAAALLEKSREVCEWYLSENQHGEYDFCSSCDAEYQMRMPTFCPSCGRRVVVK